jgi:hypothetical protein
MAGLGRKEWSPGDTLNAADVNGYLMDQSVMVFAGTAARASAIPTPSAGMVAYSTATQLQVYDGSAWVDLSTGYGVATGGTSSSITVGGINYTLLTFTSSSTLTVTKAGLFDVLLVGGGGGGSTNGFSGGGGGLITSTIYLPATTHTATVGAGGSTGAIGSESSLGSTVKGSQVSPSAVGGGGGAGGNVGSAIGVSAGSGAVTTTPAQGNNGGNGGTNAGGGGGGAGAVGGNSPSSGVGGAGGNGFDVSAFIAGSVLRKGPGAGGAALTTGGTGGLDGGGNGGSTINATAGAANSGGGGGAAGFVAGPTPAAGGSGIIYVRFKV